jgi:hypothetical protein
MSERKRSVMIRKDGNSLRPYTLHIGGELAVGFRTLVEAKQVAKQRLGTTKWRRIDTPSGVRSRLQATYLPTDGDCSPWRV